MNTELKDFSFIRLSGENTSTFLQGQLTCDIRLVAPQQALFTACCDHKGRMLANFWLFKHLDDYYLMLPEAMLSTTIEHLRKYAVFSKVMVDEDKNWAVLSYYGSDPTSQLSEANIDSVIYASLPDTEGSSHRLYYIITTTAQIPTLNDALRSDSPSSQLAQPLLEIMTGLVYVMPATTGLFIPQMIQLDRYGGISFNKGCYVGQEIIARTHHLGQLKRHLHRGEVISESPLEIGNILVNEQQQEVGIVAASTDNAKIANSYLFLAVIQDHAIDKPIYYFDQVCKLAE